MGYKMINKWMGSAVLFLAVVTSVNATTEKNWSGLYIGPNLGGIFNQAKLVSNNIGFANWDGVCNARESFSSAFVGAETGVMHQFESNIVIGLEGDFTYNFTRSVQSGCDCDFHGDIYDKFNMKNQYQGSFRGRLGYALPHNLLPFFSAGISLANLGLVYQNEGGDNYSYYSTQPGWVVGTGFDWAFAAKWSLRLEYYYDKYDRLTMSIPSIYGLADPVGAGKLNLSSNNVRASLNYWF
jgi:outer membrane immunogenic protein